MIHTQTETEMEALEAAQGSQEQKCPCGAPTRRAGFRSLWLDIHLQPVVPSFSPSNSVCFRGRQLEPPLLTKDRRRPGTCFLRL